MPIIASLSGDAASARLASHFRGMVRGMIYGAELGRRVDDWAFFVRLRSLAEWLELGHRLLEKGGERELERVTRNIVAALDNRLLLRAGASVESFLTPRRRWGKFFRGLIQALLVTLAIAAVLAALSSPAWMGWW